MLGDGWRKPWDVRVSIISSSSHLRVPVGAISNSSTPGAPDSCGNMTAAT
jgi:hypothetical protein